MRAYKGFTKMPDGSLQCRDFKYEVGKVYIYDGDISLCAYGFHACHELYQTWPFYPNNGHNVYCEVECEGDIIESDEGDGKFVCSQITILNEIDISGAAKFEGCCDFKEGFAVVSLDGRGGKENLINTKGEYLSDKWFDDCWSFSGGFCKVVLNNKYNYINTKGELISDQWFDDCWGFKECFARVKLNGKFNYVNTNGELISDKWFHQCWDFSEGFGVVRINEKFNYINTKGEILSPDQWFDLCIAFDKGLGTVKLNRRIKYISTKGEIISYHKRLDI